MEELKVNFRLKIQDIYLIDLSLPAVAINWTIT